MKETKVIVSIPQLLKLVPQHCHYSGCNRTVAVHHRIVGPTLLLTMKCRANHTQTWTSSLKHLNANGDPMFSLSLLLSACILFSGNIFRKTELLTRFLNLKLVSRVTFYRHQKKFLLPAIECTWQHHQAELLDGLSSEQSGVVLAGDGRNDSPGNSAKFCAYSLMDTNSEHIIHVEIVDKRETQLKSPNMEKLALQRSLRCPSIFKRL